MYYFNKFLYNFLLLIFYFNCLNKLCKIDSCYKKNTEIVHPHNSNLVKENFFIIDSDNLEEIESHMYGFCVSKHGIFTDNYYKKKGFYLRPKSEGVYVMIKKLEKEIIIYQDYYGNFGLYFYENKKTKYFAISNSFLYLEEYLLGKQKLTFNKDFADNYIFAELLTFSIYETMVNEIIRLPSNIIIIINIQKKNFKIHNVKNYENTIPFESEKALKIIDNWVDKWGFIIRSLNKKTSNIMYDLTGGFDTRCVLSILLNSGIEKKNMLFNSINDNISCHGEDLKIAKNLSLKYGFKLNNFTLDNNYSILNTNDSLACSLYTKFGFHKTFGLGNIFYHKPRFSFTGGGGEIIRGYPGSPIQKYLEKLSSESRKIKNLSDKYYHISMKLFNRSLIFLKKKKKYDNDYSIAASFYKKGANSIHFGRASLIGFLKNWYSFQLLMDPDLQKIKFNKKGKSSQDLMAYIYVRFAPELIYLPFERNRSINLKSIKKAEKLNKMIPPYKIKSDYDINFFIDNERQSPDNSSVCNFDEEYLLSIIKSPKFKQIIYNHYDKDIYNWAVNFNKTNRFSDLKHLQGLLAVYKVLKDIISSQ